MCTDLPRTNINETDVVISIITAHILLSHKKDMISPSPHELIARVKGMMMTTTYIMPLRNIFFRQQNRLTFEHVLHTLRTWSLFCTVKQKNLVSLCKM